MARRVGSGNRSVRARLATRSTSTGPAAVLERHAFSQDDFSSSSPASLNQAQATSSHRIAFAVFDNDGTLWCEKPTIEAIYTKLKAELLIAKRPELTREQRYISFRAHDDASCHSGRRVANPWRTHTGMTEDEFSGEVRQFTAGGGGGGGELGKL